MLHFSFSPLFFTPLSYLLSLLAIRLSHVGPCCRLAVFLQNGVKEWEGSHQDIFRTDNQAVSNFVYSSDLFKKVRQMYLEEKS